MSLLDNSFIGEDLQYDKDIQSVSALYPIGDPSVMVIISLGCQPSEIITYLLVLFTCLNGAQAANLINKTFLQ